MELERVVLADGTGVEVEVVDVGASIDIVRSPDRNGVVDLITLPLADEHRADPRRNPSVGATVGPFANRLVVDAEIVLHGGESGWSWQRWAVAEVSDTRATFTLGSAQAVYVLHRGRLDISLTVTPTCDTVVSMTNHTYWNLGGPLAEHELDVAATAAVPVDDDLLPTGPPVTLEAPIALPGEYDTCVMIDGDGFRRHASVAHARSGRRLDVWSDHPALQVYTGHWRGTTQGLALEPQHVPNAPALPWAPSAAVRAGDTYRHDLAFHITTDGGTP